MNKIKLQKEEVRRRKLSESIKIPFLQAFNNEPSLLKSMSDKIGLIDSDYSLLDGYWCVFIISFMLAQISQVARNCRISEQESSKLFSSNSLLKLISSTPIGKVVINMTAIADDPDLVTEYDLTRDINDTVQTMSKGPGNCTSISRRQAEEAVIQGTGENWTYLRGKAKRIAGKLITNPFYSLKEFKKQVPDLLNLKTDYLYSRVQPQLVESIETDTINLLLQPFTKVEIPIKIFEKVASPEGTDGYKTSLEAELGVQFYRTFSTKSTNETVLDPDEPGLDPIVRKRRLMIANKVGVKKPRAKK